VIPNWSSKLPIPARLPSILEDEVKVLRATKSKEECLRLAYGFVRRSWQTRRFYVVTHFWRAWMQDLETICARRILHCHHLDLILRALLVRSGRFTEEDIRLRRTVTWLVSPHQYLQVRTGRGWQDVDPWHAIHLGYPIGRHGGI
jgi:hypothetical protein